MYVLLWQTTFKVHCSKFKLCIYKAICIYMYMLYGHWYGIYDIIYDMIGWALDFSNLVQLPKNEKFLGLYISWNH